MKRFTCDRSTRDKAFKYYVTSHISENMKETPEGFLVCLGVPIARTGPMTYGEGETPLEVNDEGTIEIDRSEDEVFKPETIASFEGKPVTITHPTEFVSPQNWSRLAKGILQNVRRGEGEQKTDLIADLLITDSFAINLVKNGLREVSCGYEAEYTQTGEGKGTQSNIIGNHLALVDEGRAGSSYAINDHKGANKMSKFKDKISKIFASAQDEAMKVAEDEAAGKEDKKEAKDEGYKGLDELKKSVDALVEKVASMGQPTTAAKDEDKDKKDDKKKDEAGDEEVEASLEDRLKALEASVAKLLEMKAEAGDEDKEESEDEDMEESEDADMEESEDDLSSNGLTGDTASRVEILAPGMDAKTKNVKVEALKTAYKTKDGKKAIEALSGGKAPKFDDAAKVDTLFIAASELLKVQRTQDFSKTKQTRDSELVDGSSNVMTAEMMNEKNAKHYSKGAH